MRSAQITTVDASLVHKDNAEEVLLTGCRSTGADAFVVTARWPDRHSFYGPAGGYDDPLLAVEAVRQTIPFLCHTNFGVPFGHRQTWSRFSYSFSAAVLAAYGEAELELRVSCSDIVRRTDRLSSMSMHVDLMRNGIRLGSAHASFTNQSPAIYRRLRGHYANAQQALSGAVPLPAPLPPERVARQHAADVLLSPTGNRHLFRLRVDTKHPILFDHSVDHAPGMLLLEAARQAAHAAVPGTRVAAGMDVVFSRYAELDAPCWVETSVIRQLADHTIVRVLLQQNEQEIFCADVTMRCVEPLRPPGV
ncbi:ScbA/BarX family gamma-butyrolactone biosynthesis protein [Streptomyces sp. H27-C3]|uniref:ScbA/BarX family gamma-butyrolactone biosynthesis protein n=1 Tax=Streptomyces sp. H27-C3 TaxID=3046305 RepID=UPI0024BA39DD|nr:ScbA/BarX family gamma-butyrolactone biosynthesis protein [Streptomyces sp. H27-C3]MDJ0466759.1 ScbA/BarX family gamma-butyrolactone biosynthesis protein [Streptomyces sp. H27-C3]